MLGTFSNLEVKPFILCSYIRMTRYHLMTAAGL